MYTVLITRIASLLDTNSLPLNLSFQFSIHVLHLTTIMIHNKKTEQKNYVHMLLKAN